MRIDFAPYYRSTVGFDRLFNLLDASLQGEAPAYPPYNIERLDENAYRITMAVAGFAPEELTVEVKENALAIAGRKSDEQKRSYLHQGIAARSFERRFHLADFVQVKAARIENGLLHIDLAREVPEEKKVRRVPIALGDHAGARTIEGAAANAA